MIESGNFGEIEKLVQKIFTSFDDIREWSASHKLVYIEVHKKIKMFRIS